MIHIITYSGKNFEFMYLIDIKKLWLHHQAIKRRIRRGWSPTKAFDTPITSGKWKRVNHTNEQAKIRYYESCKRKTA